MTPQEYERAIERARLTPEIIEEIFHEGERTIRRHAYGEVRIPVGKAIVLRLLARRQITLDQVMRAARG